jgi:4-hydroxybenzoate polyprenyltransferase
MSVNHLRRIRIHPLVRLLRFEEYGILSIIVGLFGAFLGSSTVDISLLYLVIFIISSSAFGFVVNDISDRELDAQSPSPRNPLADGSMSLKFAGLVSAVLLLVTMVCMVLLPPKLLWIEILILFMFVTYSFLIETKNIAGLDLVYHAILPMLCGMLGYLLYHPFDRMGIIFFSLLALFGIISELLNEIRDIEKDRNKRRNSVMIIGERTAFIWTIALMGLSLVLCALLVSVEMGYYWLLPLFPFGIILITPVYRAMNDASYRTKFVNEMNTQTIKVAGISLLVYCALRFLGFM